MSTNEINLDELTRYDNLVNERENSKIRALPVVTKNDYVKYFFNGARDGKVYGVKFPYDSNDIIQATAGVKYGANAGLVVEPSTRTVVSRDDYSDINLFRGIDANVHLDSEGNVIIDYLQGDDEFSYYGKVNVVRLFPSLYERVYDEVETVGGVDTKWFHIEWTDTAKEGFTLNILCKDGTGADKGFYCIAKFPAVLIDNIPYSSAGEYPWVSAPCYNTCVDKFHAINDYQSGMTMSQYVWFQRTFMMKYGHTNYEKKLGGLTSYYYQGIAIQYSTTNKNYVVIPTSNANSLYLNTRIDVGTGDTRGAASRDIIDNCEILAKSNNIVLFSDIVTGFTIDNSDYTVASSEFSALFEKPSTTGNAVDYDGNNVTMDFTYNGDTVTVQLVLDVTGTTYTLYAYDGNSNAIGHSASGVTTNSVITIDKTTSTVAGSTYVETSIYRPGYSLEILGNDGAYQVGNFAESTRYPSVISGIEFLYGAWEVLGNAIFEYDTSGNPHVLLCNDISKVTKTVNDIHTRYTDIGYYTHTNTTNAYAYSAKISYDLTNGGCTMHCGPGSSTTGLCDATYIYGAQTTVVQREFLAFGYLRSGAACGPFCGSSNNALSNSYWYLACRPSFVGASV